MDRQLAARPECAPTSALEDTLASLRDEDRIRLLVEAVSDRALVGLDAVGLVSDWNPGAQEMTGWAAEEIIGRHYSVLCLPEEVAVGILREQLENAAASGRVEAEGWRLRRDGSRFWAEIVIAPLFAEHGALRGFAVLTRDITERRQSDQAQRKAATELAVTNAVLRRQATELIRAADLANQAARDAEAASRAKSAFLATMSHELRTPMNGLVGMAELLLESDLDDEQTQCARTVDACARSLLVVIREVLDVAALEGGRMDLELGEVDVRVALRECVTLLAPGAHAKGLDLALETSEDAPELAAGDSARVRQVLMNLIGNAIKFTPEGAVTVRAGSEQAQDGAPRVRIEIADTGIGIAEEDQERVFASFSQLDSSFSREYGGSGLGLSIAKQLVELMGGTIGVDSTPQAGSTFWFTLPADGPASPPS